MKKFIILFLILLAFPVKAALYNLNGFILDGNPEEGWIFITPNADYFSMWIGNILGTVGTDNQCIIVDEGKTRECVLRETSILLFNFPYNEIEKLKMNN